MPIAVRRTDRSATKRLADTVLDMAKASNDDVYGLVIDVATHTIEIDDLAARLRRIVEG